jgi:hypothetical protein
MTDRVLHMIEEWLFSPDQLKTLPSVVRGLSEADERTRRCQSAGHIFRIGRGLKMYVPITYNVVPTCQHHRQTFDDNCHRLRVHA